MNSFNIFPDLIVLNIIRHVYSEYKFKQSLQLLGVCQNWRHLGIPIVYNTAYYWYTLDADATSDFNSIAISLNTNLDLIRDTNLCNVPKKLFIEWASSRVNGDKLLKPFYRIISFNSTELGAFLLPEFASQFSNISTLVIYDREYAADDIILQHFAGELVSVFSNKLEIIDMDNVSTMGLSHYPANLKRMRCGFSPRSYLPLPAIDSEEIEILRIQNIPSGNICTILEASLGLEKKVVFPNLVHLGMSDGMYNITYTEDNFEQSSVPIECPRLETMDMLFNCDTPIDFSQLSTPAYMQKVFYSVETVDQLHSLSKLSTVSIGSFTVMLMGLELDDVFYQTTNYLFSKIKIGKELKVTIISGDSTEKLDYDRLKWTNVTTLTIDNVGINDIFSMVSRLPNLDTLCASYVSSRQEALPLVNLYPNKVKTIDIRDFDMRDPLEKQASCAVNIIKMLTELTRVGLPDDLKTLVTEKLNESKGRHPHFAQIEISDVYFVG